MLDKNVITVLQIVHDKLSNKNINWVLYGGTGLALHGFDFEIHDIDILTDKAGAYAINDALQEYVVTPVYLDTQHDRFESYIGEFCINNVKVEPIGNFHKKSDGKKISLTHAIHEPDFIELEKMNLPVITVQNQLQMYKLCDREKDRIKIKKIKKVLEVDGDS